MHSRTGPIVRGDFPRRPEHANRPPTNVACQRAGDCEYPACMQFGVIGNVAYRACRADPETPQATHIPAPIDEVD